MITSVPRVDVLLGSLIANQSNLTQRPSSKSEILSHRCGKMPSAEPLVIRQVEGRRETREVKKLASTTGAELDEIDEMIKGDKIYVAQKHGSIIGFFALRNLNRGNAVEVSGLAIKEIERRKGTASVLLRHAEEVALNVNAKTLYVKTSNDNIPALALYQKNGFRITEIRIGAMIEHHGAGLPGWEDIPVRDEITLEKTLLQR
jgi:N-acetylglutamate synthase-like GNAT family acetyltransferase